MAKRSVAAYAVLLLLFVLAISDIATVRGKLCEKSSKTYSGKCENKKCDKKCKEWETALHGACHKREAKSGCYCYFDCSKKPPKDAVPAPPDAATSPPPPPPDGGSPPKDGGGSPPPTDGGSPPPPAPSMH